MDRSARSFVRVCYLDGSVFRFPPSDFKLLSANGSVVIGRAHFEMAARRRRGGKPNPNVLLSVTSQLLCHAENAVKAFVGVACNVRERNQGKRRRSGGANAISWGGIWM
jgi:hypothetical protein